MNTKCEKCVFKLMNVNSKQVGCKLDITSKLLEFSKIYSIDNIKNDGEYFVLHNFYCPFGKTEDWYYKSKEAGLSEDDIESLAIISSQQKYHMVLLLDNNNIEKSINDIKNIIKFKTLINRLSIIYIHDTKNNINDLTNECIKILDNTNIIWRINHIQDAQCTTSEAIDTALESFYSQETSLITIFDCKEKIDDVLLDNINNIINFHLYKPVITMSTINEFHALSIPVSLYGAFYKKIGLVLDYLKNTNDDIILYNLA